MFIAGRRKRQTVPGRGPSGGPLTRDVINQRFAAAIARTGDMRVVREDVLGEGEGAWDADPRYPSDTVNCIIWLQLLLSEIYGYGMSPEEKIKVMDRIRYFGGLPAYGLRKCHYIDLWLKVEPEPLRRIGLEGLAGYERGFVEVDKKRFKRFHQYPCELYCEELSTFELKYLTAEGLLAHAATLTPGYYVVFPVASPYYVSLYGRSCGPMGLVHSLVLKVSPPEPGRVRGVPGTDSLVFHASIITGTVCEVPLRQYLQEMRNIFTGYALFEIDPNWDFLTPSEENEAMLRIRRCEASLPRNHDNRKL